MKNIWGFHLLCDCKSCDISKITDRKNIRLFTKKLVKRIHMKAFGEPIIKHFADHDPDKAGYTLLQLIETSNIACHFVNKTGDSYFDLHSCKSYDINVVKDTIQEFFNPQNIKTTLIERGV